MAESSSTGNSGNGNGNGNGGTGTTSTSNSGNGNGGSQSSSNGGAAAPGSQSSPNGSFSTGNDGNNGGNNGGKGPGLSFDADITSNPNGILNGGLPGFAHDYTGLASDNFGEGWGSGKHTVYQGPDGKHTVHPDANGKHTIHVDRYTKANNPSSSNPNYMTVDEVYGNLNQSIVEKQGDYEASSNEKSNVETSTFGKQDEISVTPLSVTEDKGLVNNDAIQSVEGLNFQQKDKVAQDVMEAKKSRDEAEAEDNADGMRNQLKSVAEKDAEETDAFQVGEKNTFEEENNAKLAELNQKEQEVKAAKKEELEATAAAEKAKAEEEAANAAVDNAIKDQEQVNQKTKWAVEYLNNLSSDKSPLGRFASAAKLSWDFMFNKNIKKAQAVIDSVAKDYDIDVGDTSKFISIKALSEAIETINNTIEARKQEALNNQQKAQEAATNARTHANEVTTKVQDLQANYGKAKQEYDSWKTEAWTSAEKTKAEEEEAAAKKAEETPTTEAPSYKGIINAARDEINNSKDLTDEQKAETNAVLGNVESAADAMNKAANDLAANPNAVNAQTYVKETARYNKALKAAKGNKVLKNTYFNKTFTRAVAAANDFMVTREDGTQQNYAEFAAEMAVKSPELAKGLYEAKATRLAEDGHKMLAAIETAKSKMVMTWLGSKFTFADNQVRSQFNQMAKTDMRATYATYNNVLNNETGKYSEADKAEAFDAINQAKALMTASAALQASTGFFSGIGDGTSDGVYGVTKPGDLNGYQKALNTASNYAKIALGLGVTPGANEAYQNMYYMAGAKVNESGLFSKDFDGDGFALCQEYGNNAAVGMIAGAGELATGVALMFNPATSKLGLKLTIDSIQTFLDGLYGVQKEVDDSIKYSGEVINYFNEAKSIVAETGNKEATGTIDSAIKQVEDFQLKSDEVGNLDNWLEGSGSNTADNGKFNQALSYDEWLKLIEADPVMQEYAKSLNR